VSRYSTEFEDATACSRASSTDSRSELDAELPWVNGPCYCSSVFARGKTCWYPCRLQSSLPPSITSMFSTSSLPSLSPRISMMTLLQAVSLVPTMPFCYFDANPPLKTLLPLPTHLTADSSSQRNKVYIPQPQPHTAIQLHNHNLLYIHSHQIINHVFHSRDFCRRRCCFDYAS